MPRAPPPRALPSDLMAIEPLISVSRCSLPGRRRLLRETLGSGVLAQRFGVLGALLPRHVPQPLVPGFLDFRLLRRADFADGHALLDQPLVLLLDHLLVENVIGVLHLLGGLCQNRALGLGQ